MKILLTNYFTFDTIKTTKENLLKLLNRDKVYRGKYIKRILNNIHVNRIQSIKSFKY